LKHSCSNKIIKQLFNVSRLSLARRRKNGLEKSQLPVTGFDENLNVYTGFSKRLECKVLWIFVKLESSWYTWTSTDEADNQLLQLLLWERVKNYWPSLVWY